MNFHFDEVRETDAQSWLNVTGVTAMLPAELPSGNIPGAAIRLVPLGFSNNVTDVTIAAPFRAMSGFAFPAARLAVTRRSRMDCRSCRPTPA